MAIAPNDHGISNNVCRRLGVLIAGAALLAGGVATANDEEASVSVALNFNALMNSAVAQMEGIQLPERLASVSVAADQPFTLMPERYEAMPNFGVQTITGSLNDGGAFLISTGNGVTHGAFWAADGAWTIRGDEKDAATGELLLQATPVVIDKPDCASDIKDKPEEATPALLAAVQSDRVSLAADPEDTVRVLILYDQDTVDREGDINTFAAAAISSANQAYLNSEINPMRLELAGVELLDSPVDRLGSKILGEITMRYDNAYDQIHDLRDAYDADLVCFIVYLDDYCGVAWLAPEDDTRGFSVVSTECAVGYMTFAHELGHNFGCEHDPNNADEAYTPYGYGHHWNNDAYRSVMAYSPGTRAPHFSNPNIFYEGGATGIADERDNARTINLTDVLIANMRTGDGSGPDCDLNGTPDELDIARDPLLDRDENGELDACQIANGTAHDCDGDGVMDSVQLHPRVKVSLGPGSPLSYDYPHTFTTDPLPAPISDVDIVVGATGDLASTREFITLNFNAAKIFFEAFVGSIDCYTPGMLFTHTATAEEFAPIASEGVSVIVTSDFSVSHLTCAYSAVALTIEYDADGSYLDDDSDGILSACELLCPADIFADGAINADDFALMFDQFGLVEFSLPADITGEGSVDMHDVAILQAATAGGCS